MLYPESVLAVVTVKYGRPLGLAPGLDDCDRVCEGVRESVGDCVCVGVTVRVWVWDGEMDCEGLCV